MKESGFQNGMAVYNRLWDKADVGSVIGSEASGASNGYLILVFTWLKEMDNQSG